MTQASTDTRPAMNDCWNKIGVRGDLSCPELVQHVHCRNCPVFSAGAARMLDGALPANYLTDWSRYFAQPQKGDHAQSVSALIFRVGAEWLALSTAIFEEVAEMRTIHSLPDRRNGAVLGLVNVRGELLPCVSLARMLGVDTSTAVKTDEHRIVLPRLLVVRHESARTVFPAEEVHGIQRYQPGELKDSPATVAHSVTRYTRAVLPWRGRSVGLLDDDLLGHAFNRSLSSANLT